MRRFFLCSVIALCTVPRLAFAETDDPPFKVSGYVQAQLVQNWFSHDASPNVLPDRSLPKGIGANSTIAQPDGTTTNQDVFRLRRARLRFDAWPDSHGGLTVELEPFAKGGPNGASGSFLRTVEAIGRFDLSKKTSLELAMGQFNVPFGSEILEANSERPFIDSSFASGALFPGDFDIGARGTLTSGRATVMLAIVNGMMLGEKGSALLPDLNRGKDVTTRVTYGIGPLHLGASGYVGTGQNVDPIAIRYKAFFRWAINGEATFAKSIWERLGETKLMGGITYATNMDRGASYSFALPDLPANIGSVVSDKRELGYFFRAEQDTGRWLTFGVRYDTYSPDLALDDNERRALSTVGVLRFTKGLKTMLEWDHVWDHAHTKNLSPARATTDTVSLVLQGKM